MSQPKIAYQLARLGGVTDTTPTEAQRAAASRVINRAARDAADARLIHDMLALTERNATR